MVILRIFTRPHNSVNTNYCLHNPRLFLKTQKRGVANIFRSIDASSHFRVNRKCVQPPKYTGHKIRKRRYIKRRLSNFSLNKEHRRTTRHFKIQPITILIVTQVILYLMEGLGILGWPSLTQLDIRPNCALYLNYKILSSQDHDS